MSPSFTCVHGHVFLLSPHVSPCLACLDVVSQRLSLTSCCPTPAYCRIVCRVGSHVFPTNTALESPSPSSPQPAGSCVGARRSAPILARRRPMAAHASAPPPRRRRRRRRCGADVSTAPLFHYACTCRQTLSPTLALSFQDNETGGGPDGSGAALAGDGGRSRCHRRAPC